VDAVTVLTVLSAVLFAAGAFGLLRTGLEAAARALRRARRRRGRPAWRAWPWGIRTDPEGSAAGERLPPMSAADLARAAYLLRMGWEATRSTHGALAYVADLAGAPEGLRARCRRALNALREGLPPEDALARAAAGPEERRLFALLAQLWAAGEEPVLAALGLVEAQMRRRAAALREARMALLPFRAVRWVLRAGLAAGVLAVLLPPVREGWALVPGGMLLYGLLVLAGVGTDRLLAGAIRTLEEALG